MAEWNCIEDVLNTDCSVSRVWLTVRASARATVPLSPSWLLQRLQAGKQEWMCFGNINNVTKLTVINHILICMFKIYFLYI